MPNYDYECRHCNHVFEVFQRITDDPISHCPKCGGPVKRLIGGGIGVIFKGSGFYTTDYKRSSASTEGVKGNGRDKKTASASEKSESAGKSDSSGSDSSGSDSASKSSEK
jgi:putative FmdB family regulatory protein